jgi:putative acetyltransferase
LFVHAESRGQGIGRLLLEAFLKTRNEATVDVNDQNISGRGFYEAMGFQQLSRSDTDSEGRPYPLLHMRWKTCEESWQSATTDGTILMM